MLCAYPAVFFETALELLPRPMDPHVEIIPADTEACGHIVRRFFVQIELSNQIGILRVHRLQQSLNARADNVLFLVIRRRIDLRRELREGSLTRIPAAVKIDDRSPKNPVEPCLGILLIANLIGRLHRFEQAFLNCIGGKFRVGQTLAREADEFTKVIQ